MHQRQHLVALMLKKRGVMVSDVQALTRRLVGTRTDAIVTLPFS